MNPIGRRTLLRGLGAAMSLPFLEAMLPRGVYAAGDEAKAATAAGAALGKSGQPLRLAFVCQPNGMWMDFFTPTKEGAGYDLKPTMEVMKPHQQQVSILSGLAANNARALGDGGGDHARSAAALLTGSHPLKTGGQNIRNGVSVDQVAAGVVGQNTALRSLELGCDVGRRAGDCDSGYACAYVSNVSWSNETTPMPKLIDPAIVFDRLFGTSDGRMSAEKRLGARKSILDFVAQDAKKLEGSLGASDKRKMEEFQTSVRDVERRIENAMKIDLSKMPAGTKRPEGVPQEYADHIKLMYDMQVLAFQMDVTRVSTFMVATEGSNRNFTFIGVNNGHHEVSHHGKAADKVEAIKKIDKFYMEQFAYFIKRLKETPDGDGTLLDHSLVMLASGIGDGDRHNHNDLPVILAGAGCGNVTPGRHVKYAKDTPICDLYVSMLQNAGVKTDRFGDSKGPLKGLKA